jgi:hypothetical protein
MRKAPLLIKLFSYFFVFMGVVAIFTLADAWLNSHRTTKLTISFLTNGASFEESPLLFSALALFLVSSGICGLAIVLKRAYAYDLGIIYCIAGLVFFNALIMLRIGLITSPATGIVIQALTLGGFLVYLVRHRAEWKSSHRKTFSLRELGGHR